MTTRHLCSWMDNPFYALLFERERGFLWWKRTDYTSKIHFYAAPEYRVHTDTVHGSVGGRGVTAATAMEKMSAILRRRHIDKTLTPGNTYL